LDKTLFENTYTGKTLYHEVTITNIQQLVLTSNNVSIISQIVWTQERSLR